MQNNDKLILVVDNNQASISFLVDTVLPHTGYQSVSATNAAQAWRIIDKQNPDLILLDMGLPDAQGLDMVEQLRRRKIEIPIILMAATGSEDVPLCASQLGVLDCLTKPLAADQVTAAVENALCLDRLEEERDQLTRQLQQRAHELAILERIGQSVTGVLDLDTLLNQIVETSLFITQADEGCLLLLDDKTGELYLRAATNLGEDFVRLLHLKVDDDLLEQVIRTKQPLHLSRETDPGIKVASGHVVRSLLHMPLVSQDGVIGALSVHNRTTKGAFSENDSHWLQILARQAAIALQDAKLHQELKDRTFEIEAAYAELKELNQLKTQFVQDVSHELRVPLTFIKGYVDLLREGAFGDVKPEQLEPLDIIAKRTDRITRLVSDMLTLQRLESESLELTQVNLIEVAHAAIDDAWAAARRKGLVIKEKISKTLSPIVADSEQMARFFDNLLSNAIKFTPEGGQVIVQIKEEANQMNIYVIDTGIGISPDKLGRLFARFYRASESHKKQIAGSGLGLSIVKAIVEAHGGQIVVRSREGQGSAFGFSFPKTGPDAGPVPPPELPDNPDQWLHL